MAKPKPPKSPMDALAEAVERERKLASVRSLDLSFNELADMCEQEELLIAPEYQRTFRWSLVKQSQFIESILLEMPLPPIYAVEIREGRWELIDGLQRLSTYLHFRGLLSLADREVPLVKGESFLKLEGCDIVPDLNGCLFKDLPTSLQYRVRRTTLRVEVVRRETNPKFAYHMFVRLNQGGEQLSDMEARNCSIRLLDKVFIDFLLEVVKNESFQAVVEDLTEESRVRMGIEELALRFFAFRPPDNEFDHDIEPFLTDFMRRVTEVGAGDHIPFEYATERRRFDRTFALLAATIGPNACHRWVGSVAKSGAFGGGFHRGHYEAFSVGVGRVIDDIPDPISPELLARVKEALLAVKRTQAMRDLTTGGGKNFRRLYEAKFKLVADAVRAVLQ